MAFRQRAGVPPQFPRNIYEQQQLAKCLQLGIPFPPQPMRVMAVIWTSKTEAEHALKNNDLQVSLGFYTNALIACSLCPGITEIKDEYHKLLCNRSLVFFKMRQFKDAEHDANEAISVCPSFLKGYWRASQAVKGGYSGVQRAMPYLIQGLTKALHGAGVNDIVSFLAEICVLILSAPETETMRDILSDLEIPGSEDVADIAIWIRVIQQLASNDQWTSISMLVTGYPVPPDCALTKVDSALWELSSISVGALLAVLEKQDNLQKWGEHLAICLLEQGSLVEDIGQRFGKPTLHYLVELSLRIESIQLLKYILEEKYSGQNEQFKNIQDSNGCTVLHVLVKSGLVNTDFGCIVLKLLLEHNCNAGIEDKSKRKPIDYLKGNDMAYYLLLRANQSVEDLRQDLEALKVLGNTALKDGKHQEALSLYDAALKVSKQCKQLYKEAAILYSNRANVFYTLKDYKSALTNALSAISCDNTWHKGHWWVAKTLQTLGSHRDAFSVFMEGYLKSEVTADVKINFLTEAVTLLQQIPNEHIINCYNQLRFLDGDLWPPMLVRLSKALEWKCIAFLLFGPNLDKSRFGKKVQRETIDSLCTGVAGKVSISEVQTNTVFQYLSQNNGTSCGPWLDATIFVVYVRAGAQMLKKLATDQEADCPLHAAVRLALLTGRTSLLKELIFQDRNSYHSSDNILGDSAFHAITKLRPVPESGILAKVVKILIKKGLSCNRKDASGKLAVEYLESDTPDYIFELFMKASKFIGIEDINHLKDEGNAMFNQGSYKKAVELYSKAIDLSRPNKASHFYLSDRELATLYGNRSECYLKMRDYPLALNDAMESVRLDGHWYKAHLRVGRALRNLGDLGQAMKAFINAYVVTHIEDKIRVKILVDLAITCMHIPRDILDVTKKLVDFPSGQGHLWAFACHELVSNKNWDIAAVAYFQYRVGEAKKSQVAVSLKPFCDLYMLKGYPWGLDMMLFFIKCGSDRKTISLEAGDTYLHAIVKMTLLVAKNNSLFNYVVDKYCKHRGSDQHKLDVQGNTVLHVATLQKDVDIKKRLEIISVLLKCDVSPNVVNKDGHEAVYYLPDNETASHEAFRMAMYSKETTMKQQQTAKTTQSVRKVQPSSKVSESHKPKLAQKESCLCEELLENGIDLISKDNVSDGYEKLTSLLLVPHKGSKHEHLVVKAINQIVHKLGETYNPEIPKCITSLGRDLYLRIVDTLASSNKWRQLDMVVRKYRALYGSDQLERFASNLTVVPIIKETSLKEFEDLKLQIVSNLLNSGGTLGTDNGQMALKLAVNEKSFKVVGELIKRGADTTALSVYDGDTPIHAAVSIVLEKDTPITLLEFLLDLYVKDPIMYTHLAPEQSDKNGNCIYHLAARAKYNVHVLKIVGLLYKRNISSNYHNNDGKLPIDYITKKNDRRLQHLRLAINIKPSRQHTHCVDLAEKIDQKTKESDNNNDEKDLDSEPLIQSVSEVTKLVSIRDKRKHNIDVMICLLPDSKFSIFNVDHSFSKTIVGLESGGMNKDNNLPETKVLQLQEPSPVEKVHIGNNVIKNYNILSAISAADQEELINSHEDIVCKHHVDKYGEISIADDIETAGVALKCFNFESMQKIDDQLQDTVEIVPDKAIVHAVTEKDFVNKTIKTETFVVAKEVGEGLNKNNGEVLQHDLGVVLKNVEVMIDSSDEEEYETDIEDDAEGEFELDGQVFDNLEWEVECTAEVWKTLTDKRILPDIKRRIVHKIQLLASGDWQPHLCKKLKHVPTTLKLFEAKFSKGSRVLWELAIAFSPRCSETADLRLQGNREEISQSIKGGRIYSEIIRVWEIVLDHDKLHRSVQRIKRSHLRGESCIIQKNLRGLKPDTEQVSLDAGKRYPSFFAEEDISTKGMEQHQQEMQRYFPPVSSNDSEYHILKFYTFSSILVSNVLQNIETKVDFPFRVTDLEHAIINLKSKAPILLLGRSGTGKTTCCMYRLWSQFHTYWSKAMEANARLIPRSVDFRQLEVDEDHLDDTDEDDSDSQDVCLEESSTGECHNEEDITVADEVKNTYDHLHQIFITKNAVLCNEVQKNFCELSHADELMVKHVQHEDDVLPSRLQDVHEYSFPLFLTSRQLLLMLDASLGLPHFFERKDDGSLKVDIAGWTDMDGPLSCLPLLDEDSGAEEEMEEFVEKVDFNKMEAEETATTKKLKRDPRREITYAVFVDEVWPRIKKVGHTRYHPSLIWMEIMSFIKGSYEALSNPHGHLLKSEYIKLGKKRAPNFSGERDVIYNLFEQYEHFRRHNQFFDETDLVHNVFFRLHKMVTHPWVIHQIFVDETQDFTQAELCLLLRLCQNPNDMFLTGDTAQSIMRGISFRFSDLRSLFFHAKQSMQAMGKTSAVEVPKQVYQLTHNYRSHAGILSLATSVLELMIEFFPESFDRLQPDQGLFHGPQPILLESCSFSDLAVLLQGNKRKTSHIEFGAHQVIIVVNDNARDNIPEELRLGLILTIYEAKGLEFDDVLLYNFFKDSQASKEWRVVTEFLERLAAQQKETTICHHQSLVKIDADILEKQGRPRPLNFDANQHKVLISELKHLYTALTRARVNVWIFDEDTDKRAPMFEYFKARQLVKCLHVEEIIETSLSETMFAEKSSNADWIRRGEDFMRNALYSVAAKCFEMGGDKEKQKVALAHGQALSASRMQDNPRQMRDEFLCAAELYLECNQPSKAAICLRNAKERELAARLFEKLGQFERAADMYREMKLPMASSKCYEQLGNFNKAVEVLDENKYYDMAIDALRRYHNKIQDLKKNQCPIPQQLIDNAPEVFYTEEKLSHKSAELFHRSNNEERMLKAIEKFQNINDKVEFLKKRGYIQHGAKILQDAGQLENAADMLLKYGYIDEAENMARGTLNEAVIAQCLLVKCRVLMSKKDLQKKSHLVSWLKESMEMFQTSKNNDGVGMVNLLLGEHLGDVGHIKDAWKAFKDLETFFNEAGMIECSDWLVRFGDVDNVSILECIVKSVQYVFNICNALLEPNTVSNLQKVQKIHSFYGLSPQSQEKLAVFPKEKPRCLTMIHNMFKTKSEQKSSSIEFNKTQVHENIVAFLLKRSKQWIDKAMETLNKLRDMTTVCGNVQAGLECPNFGGVDNSCRKLHVPQTEDHFIKLIKIDLLFIELESCIIQKGTSFLMKNNFSSKIVDLAKDIFQLFTGNSSHHLEKYQTCKHLWDDIMPTAGHSMLIGDSRTLISYLRNNDGVIMYLRQWLLDKWLNAIEEHHDKALKCAAVRETEIFLIFEFGYHLFGLDTGQRKLDSSPSVEMTKLEMRLDKEIAYKGSNFKKKAYTLMIAEEEKRPLSVQCVARRFTDAYTYISNNNPDPFEAVIKFNKFMIQLNQHSNVTFFPEMKHYLMWVEFYTTLAIFLMAKIKTHTFKEFLFILPSNFLALVQFVKETFPNSGKKYSVAAIVDWWKFFPRCDEKLSDRLKFITFGVSGHRQAINIANELLTLCSRDPTNYVLIERLWILTMVLVCNGGKAVPMECEISLMRSMCALKMPEEAPQRLKSVQSKLQQAQGVTNVAHILTELLTLRQQKEKLLVCKWKSGEQINIVTEELQNLSFFSEKFLNPKTLDTMHNIGNITEPQAPVVEHMEETDLTEEEIQKGKIDKEVQLEEAHRTQKTKRRAASVIISFFKSVLAKKKQRNMQKEIKNGYERLFDGVEGNNKVCGICDIYFEQKLKEKLELDNETLIGDKPLLNEQSKNIDISGNNSDSAQNSEGSAQNSEGSAQNSEGSAQNDTDGAQNSKGSAQNSNSIAQNDTDGTKNSKGSAQNSIDNVQNQSSVWEISQESTNNVAIEKQKLSQIRQAHLAELSHLDKYKEFERFIKHFREDIAPKLQNVNDFLSNPTYRLSEASYREQHYDRYQVEINKMLWMFNECDKDLQELVYSKKWSTTERKINQTVVELMTHLKTVQPYVEEVQIRLKQEEERLKLTSATTAAKVAGGDNSRDDLEDIEPVVKEPEIKRPYKQTVNRYKRERKLNIGPRYYKNRAAKGNTSLAGDNT